MAKDRIPPVINPGVDVGDELNFLIVDTGGLEELMGGYRIKVFHTRAFPWDEVFKVLLFRDFKVYVTRHKADIYIEAQP
jgi:hypothetical protein